VHVLRNRESVPVSQCCSMIYGNPGTRFHQGLQTGSGKRMLPQSAFGAKRREWATACDSMLYFIGLGLNTGVVVPSGPKMAERDEE
jgi:hypothetical protein